MEKAAPVSALFEFEAPKFSRNLIRIEMERRASRKFKLGFFFFFLVRLLILKKKREEKERRNKSIKVFLERDLGDQ